MSIVNYKNTTTDVPNTNPQMEYVSEYSSRLDKLSAISLNLEGTPWRVDYVHQILAENEDAKFLDVNMSVTNQSYSFIADMRLHVTDPLTSSVDDETGVTTVTGSSNVYGFLKPAVGDMLIATMIEGGTGLLAITEVTSNSYNKRQHYNITYNLTDILEESPEKFTNIKQKIKMQYVFDADLLKSGNIPIITLEQGRNRSELSSLLTIVLKDYVRDFVNRDTETFLVPTDKGYRIYDDYLVEFVRHILDTVNIGRRPAIMRYTVDDRSSSVTSLWTVLMDRGYLNTDIVDSMVGVETRSSYSKNKVGASMRYAPIDFIVKLASDHKNPSWKHMHDVLGITVPDHVDTDANGVALPAPVTVPSAPIITTAENNPATAPIPWTNPNPPAEKLIIITVNGKVVAAPNGASVFKQSEVYEYLKTWVSPEGVVSDKVETMNRVGDTIYIFTTDYQYHSGDGVQLHNLGVSHDITTTAPNGDKVTTYYNEKDEIVKVDTVSLLNGITTTTTTDKDGGILGMVTVQGIDPNVITTEYDKELFKVKETSITVDPNTNHRTTVEKVYLNNVLQSESTVEVDPDYKLVNSIVSKVVIPGDDLEADVQKELTNTTADGVITKTVISTDQSMTTTVTAGDVVTVTNVDPQGEVTRTVTTTTDTVAGLVTVVDVNVAESKVTTTTTLGDVVESIEVVTDDDGSTVTTSIKTNETIVTAKNAVGHILSITTTRSVGGNIEVRHNDLVTGTTTVTTETPEGNPVSIVTTKANGDTKVTDADGNTVEEIKNTDGSVATSITVNTDPDGTVTRTVYDSTGGVVSKSVVYVDPNTGSTTTTVLGGGVSTTTVVKDDGVRLSKTTLIPNGVNVLVKTAYGQTDDDVLYTTTITTEGDVETSVKVEENIVTTSVSKAGVAVSKSVAVTDPVSGDVRTTYTTGPDDTPSHTALTVGNTTIETYPDKIRTIVTYPEGNVRELIKLNGSDHTNETYKNANGDLISTVSREFKPDGTLVHEYLIMALSGDRTYTYYDDTGAVKEVKTYTFTDTKKTIISKDPDGNVNYTITAARVSFSSIKITAVDDAGITIPVTEGMISPYGEFVKSELAETMQAEEIERNGVDLITVVKNPEDSNFVIIGGIINTGSKEEPGPVTPVDPEPTGEEGDLTLSQGEIDETFLPD